MSKKFYSIFLLVILIFSNITTAFSDTQNPNSVSNHIDAVLVIDTSNSMNGNDPNHIAVEGVKLFIDMMEYNGSRVSVIGFNGKITFQIPLTEINTFEDKSKILNRLDKIVYEGYTDIGLALKESEKVLFSNTNNNKPIVVMFTDGFVEVDKVTGRTEAQSKDEIEQVILGAKSNYPIYTIGLNKKDRVDEELIKRIATETNAKNYMTSDPKDLPEIFNELFARHIKSNIINIGTITTDGIGYNLIDINIPNASVSEANIVLLSKEKLIDAKLINPKGVEVELKSNTDVYISKSNLYSVIKIIKPEKGNWILSIKGVKNDEIKINLLYNYYINLEAEIINKNIKKGDTITIKGSLVNENNNLIDSDLLASFNADLEVYDDNNKLLEKFPMNIVGDVFTYDYKLPEQTQDLTFIIKAAGSGFYRESNVIDLKIENISPTLKNKIKGRLLFTLPFLNNSIEIKMLDYFEDEDDKELSYKIEQTKDKFKFEEEKDAYKIIATKNFELASTIITIKAIDSANNTVDASFKVTTVPILFIIFIILLFIILIILAPKFIKNIDENGRILKGRIKCIVVSSGIYGESKAPTELALFKGRVKISEVVSDPETSKLNELNKISFVQAKGRYALDFTNNSTYKISNISKLEKTFSLNQGNTITIYNEEENIELKLTYIE